MHESFNQVDSVAEQLFSNSWKENSFLILMQPQKFLYITTLTENLEVRT